MALSRQNKSSANKFLSSLGSVLANALVSNPNAYGNAWETGRVLSQYIKDSPKVIAGPEPGQPNRSGNGRSGRTRGRRRGKEKKANNDNADVFRQINLGPVSSVKPVRSTMTGIFSLVTGGTAGVAQYVLPMGWENGASNKLFWYLSSDSTKLLGAFEKAVVHRVTLKFIGTQASTATGWFALGMDSSTDATIALPSTIQDVTNNNQCVVIADVKGEASLTYAPKGSDREIRLIDTSVNASDKYCGRMMALLGGSNVPITTAFGLLQITVDLTLIQ